MPLAAVKIKFSIFSELLIMLLHGCSTGLYRVKNVRDMVGKRPRHRSGCIQNGGQITIIGVVNIYKAQTQNIHLKIFLKTEHPPHP